MTPDQKTKQACLIKHSYLLCKTASNCGFLRKCCYEAFLPVVQTSAPMCFLRKCCYVLRRVRDITDKSSGGVHKTMLKWMPCSGPMPAILATESLVGLQMQFCSWQSDFIRVNGQQFFSSCLRHAQFETQKSSILSPVRFLRNSNCLLALADV